MVFHDTKPLKTMSNDAKLSSELCKELREYLYEVNAPRIRSAEIDRR